MKKRCETCGDVREYPARVRRCRKRIGLLGSFCCWGRVVAVPPPPRRPEFKAKPAADADPKKPKPTPQERAAKKLETIRRALDLKRAARNRLEATIVRLERKAVRLEKTVAMTPEQVEQRRLARLARKAKRSKPVRRAIKVGGVEKDAAASP